MGMKNSRELLEILGKTARMGQVDIHSILDTFMERELHTLLARQLRELEALEQEAHGLGFQRGWELGAPDPVAIFLCDRRNRLRIGQRNRESAIAALLIQRNTDRMIRLLQSRHRCFGQDGQVCALSQRLLDSQRDSIRQLQRFL